MKSVFVFFSICLISFSAPWSPASSSATQESKLDKELLKIVYLGDTPLLENPVRHFDLNRVQDLILRGANVNAQNSAGDSVVHLMFKSIVGLPPENADFKQLLAGISFVLSKGADVNLVDNQGRNAGFDVIYNGALNVLFGYASPDVPLLLKVISSGAAQPNWNQRDTEGRSVIFYALKFRAEREVHYLVEHGARIDMVDEMGQNLAFVAIAGTDTRQLQILESLIPENERSSYFETKSNTGSTPFLGAVFSNNTAAATYLLEKYHVNANAEDLEGYNATRVIKKRLSNHFYHGELLQKQKDLLNQITVAGGHDVNVPSEINCAGHNFEPLTFDKLRNVVNACKVADVDHLLPLLPKSILSNHVLFYHSRGFLESSLSKPVVVLAGSEGTAFLAFNGDPKLRGYNNLDFIGLKEEAGVKSFEMRTIEFQNNRPHFSRKNPGACLACHGGANPRPLFETWSLWPGVYGSEQDVMFPAEKNLYVSHFKPNEKSGRYRFLLPNGDSTISAPSGELSFAELHVSRVSSLIEIKTAEVITSQLAKSQKLKNYRFAILGALSCKDPIESFFLPGPGQSVGAKLDDIRKESRAVFHDEYLNRMRRQKENIPESPQGPYALENLSASDPYYGEIQDLERISRLRYALQQAGEDMNWSTTLSPNHDRKYRYAVHDLMYYDFGLWRAFLSSKKSGEAQIRELYQARFDQLTPDGNTNFGLFQGPGFATDFKGVDPAPVCKLLKEASLKALAH